MRVVLCGRERVDDVHRLTQAAFAPHLLLDPPSGAGSESTAGVADDLDAGGGAVAELDGRPVGCLRWQVSEDGDFHVRRVAVSPDLQRKGIGRTLMAWAEREALRQMCPAISLGVRVALPDNLEFFERLGYVVTGEHRHDGYEHTTWLALRKDLLK